MVTTLVYIRPGNAKETLVLGLSVGENEKTEAFTVPASVYMEIGEPLTGETLSEESTDFIRSEAARRKAEKTALRLMAFGDNSQRQLRRKLEQRGFTREESEAAVEQTVSLGYLDEARQVRRLVESAANGKLWGPARILADLVAKGYERREIEENIASLTENGTVDFHDNFAKLLQKKQVSPSDTLSIRKLRFTFGYTN